MKKTPIRRVSSKQKNELARRSRLKKELLAEGRKDGAGRTLCSTCGKLPDFRGLQLSHKIPLARGGKTIRENCCIECAPCHAISHGLRE